MKNTAIKGIIIPNDYEWIYDLFEVDYASPRKLIKDLDEADGDEVHVDINSPGGYVTAGSEMYSALRTYKGPVTIDVVGQAASAASVAAMARHSRISPTATLMIHNVSLDGVSGDYHEMDKASATLQELTNSVANAYVEKTGMDRNKILEMMDRERTIEATDAIKEGFIDELIPAEPDGQALRATALTGCNVIPEDVIKRVSNLVNHQPEGADLAAAYIKLLELESED